MTVQGWSQILLFFLLVLALVPPLGAFLHRVLEGEPHLLRRPLGWLERLLYRLGGTDGREQSWPAYSLALLAFSALTMLVTYAVQRLQHRLPWNPQGLGPVEPGSAFNTAVSFTTNTNWQAYARRGDDELPHPDGRARRCTTSSRPRPASPWRSRSSAASPRAAASGTIGNFWVDLTRSTLYVLLPLSFVLALVLVSQGVSQNLQRRTRRRRRSRARRRSIAHGPVASQEAIKQLGTNGGGFFNANSAHPFENPTPLTQPPRRCCSSSLIPAGAHLHLRPDGRRPAPGLGALRGDGAAVPRRASASATGPRRRGNPIVAQASTGVDRRPAATWRARRSASGSRARRCSRP